MIEQTKQIEKIYSGRDHCCRCGCGGKYYYPQDRMFNSILKKAMAKMNDSTSQVDDCGQYINISYGCNDRAYTIYYK